MLFVRPRIYQLQYFTPGEQGNFNQRSPKFQRHKELNCTVALPAHKSATSESPYFNTHTSST